MFGEFLSFVFFGIVVYLIVKTVLKDVLPGVCDGLIVVLKIVLKLALFPLFLVFGIVKLFLGVDKSEVVGVEKETITITDRFVDKKGRSVRIDKTINVGARAVTKKDLNRIR